MDRAHRLGQRRTVNVYRLLMSGTIEEEVLSLQRFKLDVAGALVNADNASLQSMDAGRALDLMGAAAQGAAVPGTKPRKLAGLAGLLAELPDVEETVAQYEAEFAQE